MQPVKLWNIVKDPKTKWKDIQPLINDNVDTVLKSPRVTYHHCASDENDLYEVYCLCSEKDECIKDEFFQYLDT